MNITSVTQKDEKAHIDPCNQDSDTTERINRMAEHIKYVGLRYLFRIDFNSVEQKIIKEILESKGGIK